MSEFVIEVDTEFISIVACECKRDFSFYHNYVHRCECGHVWKNNEKPGCVIIVSEGDGDFISILASMDLVSIRDECDREIMEVIDGML